MAGWGWVAGWGGGEVRIIRKLNKWYSEGQAVVWSSK